MNPNRNHHLHSRAEKAHRRLEEHRAQRHRQTPLVHGGQGRPSWDVERAVALWAACVSGAVALALIAQVLS